MIARQAVAEIIGQVRAVWGCTCTGFVALTVLDFDGASLEPDDDVGDGRGVVVAWDHQAGCPCRPRPRRFEAPV